MHKSQNIKDSDFAKAFAYGLALANKVGRQSKDKKEPAFCKASSFFNYKRI
jgi:hypothetical protein